MPIHYVHEFSRTACGPIVCSCGRRQCESESREYTGAHRCLNFTAPGKARCATHERRDAPRVYAGPPAAAGGRL